MDVSEEEKFGAEELRRDLRIEGFEDVQLGCLGDRLVEVFAVVLAGPMEGLAGAAFQTFKMNATIAQHGFVLWLKIVTHDGDEGDVGEITGRERKVGGGAAELALHLAKRALDSVK